MHDTACINATSVITFTTHVRSSGNFWLELTLLPKVNLQNYLVGGALSDTKQLLQNFCNQFSFSPTLGSTTPAQIESNSKRISSHPGVDRLGSSTQAHAIPAGSDGYLGSLLAL